MAYPSRNCYRNVDFSYDRTVRSHCMAQGGRPETSCGQDSWPVHRTRRYSHNIDRLRCTLSRKRPRREPGSSRRPRRGVRRESTPRLPTSPTAQTMSSRCMAIIPMIDAAYSRSPPVQSGPGHAEHCCCSFALRMACFTAPPTLDQT